MAQQKEELRIRQAEVTKLQEEMAVIKDTSRNANAAYDRKLEEINEEVNLLRNKERPNLAETREKLAVNMERLNAVKETRVRKREEGEEFLRKVTEVTVSNMEQCNKHRD